MKHLLLPAILAIFALLGVACDAEKGSTPTDDAVVTPDTNNADSGQPDVGEPDTSVQPDTTPVDPCEQYEWMLVDEDGKEIGWTCPKWANGDIGLQMEERDGVCYFMSDLFEVPATDLTLDPPDRFVGHAPPPFGDADCIPL